MVTEAKEAEFQRKRQERKEEAHKMYKIIKRDINRAVSNTYKMSAQTGNSETLNLVIDDLVRAADELCNYFMVGSPLVINTNSNLLSMRDVYEFKCKENK
jgi:hypothetical protein